MCVTLCYCLYSTVRVIVVIYDWAIEYVSTCLCVVVHVTVYDYVDYVCGRGYKKFNMWLDMCLCVIVYVIRVVMSDCVCLCMIDSVCSYNWLCKFVYNFIYI